MDTGTSRRGVLGAAAIGIGGLVGTNAIAQGSTTPATGPGAATPLRDPRTKYTSTPFPEQHQPWPGLQSKMNPKPDCGERSYRGSGKLAGRKALLTGADSGIGRAAAIAFAREGADVAIKLSPRRGTRWRARSSI